MTWPRNEPDGEHDRRDPQSVVLLALDQVEVGDFDPLKLALTDPEISMSEWEPHRARLARALAGLTLTTAERHRRIRRDYRACRERGLSADDSYDDVAARWGDTADTIHNVVNRSGRRRKSRKSKGRSSRARRSHRSKDRRE